MKLINYLKLILIVIIFSSGDGVKCPTKGDSDNKKHQESDILKNRSIASKTLTKISLDSVLKPGDDKKRFNQNTFVEITGYVFNVKRGGSETCNCHSDDKSQLDIHIELVRSLSETEDTKRMIVEINRYTIANNKSMEYRLIKLLVGKKVNITGWLFFDEEHKQNAINTSPKGTNIWRATCWEVHPCISIKEIN